jgi:peptidoglycan/xylan/chitin deacetylase (PgdA/CDA1 family)
MLAAMPTPAPRLPILRLFTVACALATTLGCSSNGQGNAGAGGSSGGGTSGGGTGGGAGNAGNSGTTGGGGAPPPRVVSTVSGLPQVATTGVAKPAGTPGNLTVLDWAGFKAAVSWTFDDSQPSQIDHYAELQAVGVPMTFYISPGNGGGASYDTTWSRAVADGHELGNHTMHHCHADLTGCSFGTAAATLGDELDQASAFIAQHYPAQGTAWTTASPFGDGGYVTPASSRFLVNRGVNSGMIGAKDSTDPFSLPIHLASEGETATAFNNLSDMARSSGRWLIFLIHTITPTTANWYAPVAITEVTAAMEHDRDLTDVWTDTVVAVAAYWRAQKLFAGLTPATSADSKTWTWTLPAHFPPGKYLRVKVDGGTLTQGGAPLPWDEHGYYEIALDAGTLTLAP